MIRGKYLMYGDDLTDANTIRRQVFVDEQGMDVADVFDDLDKVSVHGIVYNENEIPVASGRIAVDNGVYRIGKIAVKQEYRGQKLGDFLVRMLVDKGYVAGANVVWVHAQLHAVGFYEKIGFVKEGSIRKDPDGLMVQPMKLIKGALCKECQNKDCGTCSSK